jgi:cell wall assembly regulator SMI1
MTEFRKFADRFNKSTNAAPSTQSDIDKLEKELNIQLPNDYKRFLLSIGNIWTPDILDLVVDKELDLADVQQFWTPDEIIDDKKNFWTKQVSTDIIPFATDCMGNIFSFLASDLRQKTETADIYFFDHDFDTVEKISNSFTVWINNFNKI